ncbi:MAG TPA: hypothetical protein VI959_02715 [Alphaproteobacteria bacterium]|nr:hypothetical protein [Alphaproteobacteria bacterium]
MAYVNWQNYLNEVGINYFSLSVFKEDLSLLCYCNNSKWFSLYKESYLPTPPVQNHILKISEGLIIWDSDFFAQDIAFYIKKRNEITNSNAIWTLVTRKDDLKTAISFGSKYDALHMYHFITRNKQEISGFSSFVTGQF